MSTTLPQTHLWEIALSGDRVQTAASYLQQKLLDRNFRVFIAHTYDTVDLQSYPTHIWINHAIRFQRAQRQFWREMAYDLLQDDNQPTVIIYPQTELDFVADQTQLEQHLLNANLTLREVRDTYDIALVFQTQDNSSLHSRWIGHPHLRPIIIENDYEQTLEKSLLAMNSLIGFPAHEYERKFVLDALPNSEILDRSQPIEIVQTYLVDSDDQYETRLRKRSQGSHHTYYQTRKRWIAEGVREEEDQIISLAQYNERLLEKDSDRQPILKTRYCLLELGHYLELDHFHTPHGLIMLEIETDTPNGDVTLPQWVLDLNPREVTDDPAYQNHNIAKL